MDDVDGLGQHRGLVPEERKERFRGWESEKYRTQYHPGQIQIQVIGFGILIWLVPVDDVGKQVVVPQPVVHVHLLVVDRQRSVEDASLLKKVKSPMVATCKCLNENMTPLTYSSTG